MPQMLILVHGMGTSPAGWADAPGGPKVKLNELARQYSAFKTGKPFTDRLLVREIAYDHCFDEIVTQWAAQSSELDSWASGLGHAMPKLVHWLDSTLPSTSAAKEFFWSTAIDPLLYRGSVLFRKRVRVAVMTALVEHLREAAAESADVTLVAHSLGTAVMHDTLHLLGNGSLPDEVKDVESLRPPRWWFSNLFMIADVCRLGPKWVHDIDDYYTSIVRPVSPSGNPPGYCDNFFEVWHRYDPFASAAPFRPTDWGGGYQPIGPLSHFRQANVHGFTHYLDHPAVHVPLINYSLAAQAITANEAAGARATYADVVSPECDQQIERMKENAKEFTSDAELEDLVIKIAEFYALAKDAGDKCRGIAIT